MRWLTWLRMRLRALLRSGDLDRDLDEELRYHVQREIAVRVRKGMSAEQAQRQALLAFGGMEQIREASRDARGLRLIEDVRQDVRYGLRTLRRAPTFALVVVAILGLGIGLTSALFAALHGVLLKPLPYANAPDVHVLWQSQPAAGHLRDEFSPANFMDAREQLTSFRQLAAALEFGLDYMSPDGPETWQAWAVTEGFFETLGAAAQLGRTFTASDYATDAPLTALLSHDLWVRRFGSDPAWIGATLTLDDQPRQIIGVLPAAFQFPTRKEVYIPAVLTEQMRQQRGATYLTVIGRLRPELTEAQAAPELNALARRLAAEYPRTNAGVEFVTVPLKEQIVGDIRPVLVLLMSAVAVLLLVACSNVANLFLARTTGRAREFALRGALGARGARLARQLLAEGAVLAAAGGAAGLLIAHYGVRFIRRFAPADVPRLDEIAFEPRVALFAVAIATLTVLAFAAVPALRAARTDPVEGLSAPRATAGARRRRLSAALVIAEVAFSFVLVIGAGLIVRSFVNLTRVDPGYRTDGVAAMSVFLWGRYNTPDQQRGFIRELEERVRALPGVTAFGVATSLPLHQRIGREDADIVPDGMVAAPGEAPVVRGATASPGYFEALRIPLLQGRTFNHADDANSYPVALISEALAKRFFAEQDPIGRNLSVSFPAGAVQRQIVGVVGDVRHVGLDETPRPTVYVPFSQAPNGALVLTVRVNGAAADVITPISETIWSIAPTLPLYSTATLDELRHASLRVQRFVLLLLGMFALSALTLAALGVYGVLSNATAERTREFGLRLALGATAHEILQGVVANGVMLAGFGLAIGCLAAAAATRLLRAMLFGVTTFDVTTFVGAAGVILVSAMIASLLPAWRAARVDPGITLKE